MLDLAGYNVENNLVDLVTVEPAAGEGAFLLQMIERLIQSCHAQNRAVSDCRSSIRAYDTDPKAAAIARRAVISKLIELEVSEDLAHQLTDGWIKERDYLLEFGELLSSVDNNGDARPMPADILLDFVIGNPPYIRLEDLPDDLNTRYRELFSTMVGRADIYIAFYEAALRQLKPGGVCAFICPDRWMLNQYGRELRGLVTSAYSLETLIAMQDAGAFETQVSSYPAITIIRRATQGRVVVASANQDANPPDPASISDSINQLRHNCAESIDTPVLRAYRKDKWFDSSDPWPCTSPDRLALLRKLEKNFQPLESDATGTRVGIGVATGTDAVYVTNESSVVEIDRLLPLAMVDDLRTGVLQWSGHYLVNPWTDGGLVDLEEYPRLREYYQKHAEQIKNRNVAKRNPEAWYRTIDRVNHSLLDRHKLYIPDIKNTIHAVLDRGETYPHHNLYFVVSNNWNLEILGALLMSDVGRFFVECYGVRIRGGYLRMQAQYLRRVRVPDIESVSEKQAESLTKAFRERDTALATRAALEIYGIDRIPA